jgi:putative DNA-invertase from lambdoid prophage Rac
MKIAYGYGRASLDKQVLPLEAQDKDCLAAFQERYAKDFTYGGFFPEEAEHGDTPFFQRPVAAELCQRLAKGNVVIATKVDRPFRDFADCFQVLADWSKRKIVLYPIEFGADTSTHAGLMVVQIRASVAQYELSQIRDRTRRVLQHRKAKHGFTNQFPGYGWKLVGPQGKRQRVPADEERTQMAAIVRMYEQEGLSLEEVYWHFVRTGERTPTWTVWKYDAVRDRYVQQTVGGKLWSYDRIKRTYKALKQPSEGDRPWVEALLQGLGSNGTNGRQAGGCP